MPAATEIQLANAIVSELNGPYQPWPLPFAASRSWNPWNAGADLTSLAVYVLPMTVPKSERASRGQPWEWEYGVVIDFQQEVPIDTDPPTTAGAQNTAGLPNQAAVDALCGLVEAVMDAYRDNHVLAGMAAGEWYAIKVERPELFVPDRLFDEHVFESWIELTIRGYR